MGSLKKEVEEAAPVLPDHEVERVLAVIDKRLAGVPTTPEATVLGKAEELIRGDRLKHYGHPELNFGRIADAWSAFLGKEVSKVDVCVMMILLKSMRVAEGYHHDSFVDIGGYTALGAILAGDDKL